MMNHRLNQDPVMEKLIARVMVDGKRSKAEKIVLESEIEFLKAEYPELAEQFDMLWHAIDTDSLDKTSDFYLKLKAVKDANPKPS